MKLLALAIASAALSVSCSGGNGSANNSPPPAPPDVTGNWHVTSTSSINAVVIHSDGPMLDQSGQITANVAGDAADPACQGVAAGGGISGLFTGAQSGQNIPLASAGVFTITMSLTSATDANSLSGSYTMSSGCTDNGTVAGVRVPSLTGSSWNGTMDSGPTTFTATLTQASPVASTISQDGNSYLALTGSVQFTSSTCFASGSLIGPGSFVYGTHIGLNISMGDGMNLSATGQISDPATAKTTTLTYTIYPATSGGTGPCNGQTGTFTMSR